MKVECSDIPGTYYVFDNDDEPCGSIHVNTGAGAEMRPFLNGHNAYGVLSRHEFSLRVLLQDLRNSGALPALADVELKTLLDRLRLDIGTLRIQMIANKSEVDHA